MSASVTKRTALPLVAIVATFFLPMAQSCDHAVSPLSYIRESGLAGAFWVAPTFVVAAVLVATIFASWRARAKTALAFVGTSALTATLPVFAALFATEGAKVLTALYAVASVAAAWLTKRAFAKKGAERLSAVLDTYAVAAFPLAFTIGSLGKYWGAHVFLVAYVAFATQRLLVFLQERIPSQRARIRVAMPVRVAAEAAAQGEVIEDEEEDLEAWSSRSRSLRSR